MQENASSAVAINNLIAALWLLCRTEISKLGEQKELDALDVLSSPGGQVHFEITLPTLSLVCSIRSGDNAFEEKFRLEGSCGADTFGFGNKAN